MQVNVRHRVPTTAALISQQETRKGNPTHKSQKSPLPQPKQRLRHHLEHLQQLLEKHPAREISAFSRAGAITRAPADAGKKCALAKSVRAALYMPPRVQRTTQPRATQPSYSSVARIWKIPHRFCAAVAMPPRRRSISGYRGVHARPNGTFTAEIRSDDDSTTASHSGCTRRR